MSEAKRWQKDKNPDLDRHYVRLEKIIDAFLARTDNKNVQAIERERLVAEGDVEAVKALCDKWAEEYFAIYRR